MKAFVYFLGSLLLFIGSLVQLGVFEDLVSTSKRVNNYHAVALTQIKHNQVLKKKISDLQYEVQTLNAQKRFLKSKLDQNKGRSRKMASLAPKLNVKDDLVKDSVFSWKPKQLKKIAEGEFAKKNYEKAAQFYQTLIMKNPQGEMIDDQLLFMAGLAAYESGNHYDWAKAHLGKIVQNYPTSQYFRGAKLWIGLSDLMQGDKKAFFKTVEEFRLKYRNTHEWKIISGHYEEIRKNYR